MPIGHCAEAVLVVRHPNAPASPGESHIGRAFCVRCQAWDSCPHPWEHKRMRTCFAWEKDPLPACAWCAACGSTLDVSVAPEYNTNVRKENTVNASGTHIEWRLLTPDTVPPARTPVLLQLRVLPVPLLKVGQDAVKDAEEAKRPLLERGTFYGYVTAVLDFTLDGFGRPAPVGFRTFTLGATSDVMVLDDAIPFNKVEAWAVL